MTMFLSDMFRQNGATLVGWERVWRREAMPTSTLPTGLAVYAKPWHLIA